MFVLFKVRRPSIDDLTPARCRSASRRASSRGRERDAGRPLPLAAAIVGAMLLFAASVTFAASVAAAPLTVASGGLGASADTADGSGREIFEEAKCARCHAVASLDIESQMKPPMGGPTLDEVKTERTVAWLRNYLKGSEELNGKAHLFRWRGTDEQLTALVDWLLELREKKDR